MDPIERDELVRTLAYRLARGDLSSETVLPVLARLCGDGRPEKTQTVDALIDALLRVPGEETEALAAHLREVQMKRALDARWRDASGPENDAFYLSGLPISVSPPWESPDGVGADLNNQLHRAGDWIFAWQHRSEASRIFDVVDARFRSAIGEFRVKLAPHRDLIHAAIENALDGESSEQNEATLALIEAEKAAVSADSEAFLADPKLPIENEETAIDDQLVAKGLLKHFRNASTREGQQSLLEIACGWRSQWIIPTLLKMCQEPWAQDRACLLLALRFDSPSRRTWPQWQVWLSEQLANFTRGRSSIAAALRSSPLESHAVWFFDREETAKLLDPLGPSAIAVQPEDFVNRWSGVIDADEWNTITGYERPKPPPIPVESNPQATPPPFPSVPAIDPATSEIAQPVQPPSMPTQKTVAKAVSEPEPKQEPKPKPKVPSIWEAHIQPFVLENWYLVAGIAMVVVGSSLLAYYTWDKHWLWRYTIMPLLLASFTAALAGAGRWIAARGNQFRGTAAMLRGTAIALLPVNFMTMALVANDPQVSQKVLALSCMGLVYVFLAGWGLRRWCSAEHPGLGWVLGGTLLLLNSLAGLAPLASAAGGVDGQALLTVLGIGFHIGFLVVAWAVVHFARHVLTTDLAKENRVPWFFGLTLGITFVQVFAWVHGYLEHLPQVHTYAPMIVLAGGLVLFTERHALELSGTPREHRAESFFGYAFILLGVIMGATHELVRILTFGLASIAWIYQASPRRQALHFWIGLSLLVMAGASVGLLEAYPKAWLPAIGIVIGLGMTAGDYLMRRRNPQLAEACRGIQLAVLVLTVVVAVLTQWHFRTEPWVTGLCLLIISGFCIWSALRDDELRWMDAAMVVLALALPYVGFVDMKGRTLFGNKMVFALGCVSALWIFLAWRLRRIRVIIESRSTVLWIYGALAVMGMVLRVVIERGAPLDLEWHNVFMDYAGPFIMAGALGFAAYYSRSLIPAFMAAIIAIILFPELKANFQQYLPDKVWGSGMGSTISALAMVIACFVLRRIPALQTLEGGDKLFGRIPFPARRTDYTIFTVPLLFSSVFLLVKIDAVTAWINIASHPNLVVNSAIALLVSSVAWTTTAAYLRKYKGAEAGVHFGWVTLLAGTIVLFDHWAPDLDWTWPFLITGLILQAAWFFYRRLSRKLPWVDDLMGKPTLAVLRGGSGLVSLAVIVSLIFGLVQIDRDWPIVLFLVLQLGWHGLATRQLAFGTLLALLLWVVLNAWLVPGADSLILRLRFADSTLLPSLWFVGGVHLALIAFESLPERFFSRARALAKPFLAFVSALALCLGAIGLFLGQNSTELVRILMVGAVLLTARAQRSGYVALLGSALCYVFIATDADALPVERLAQLLIPWKLAGFAFVITGTTFACQWLHRQRDGLLCGPFSQRGFRSPFPDWLYVPAITTGTLASLAHTVSPVLRERVAELWTPYLAAAAALITLFVWRNAIPRVLATLLFVLGNIHSVRLGLGDFLRDQGLSANHLICLGTTFSLVITWLLRFPFRGRDAVAYFNQVTLALAAFILVLLAANYFTHPDLSQITPSRFLVSGSMALLAGLFFRRAARKPGPGEENYSPVCEGFYHFGVVMALWCAALLIPWLRDPARALAALAFPVFYFFANAELAWRRHADSANRYKTTATVLAFLMLALYVFRGAFQLVLFPDAAVDTMHYHYNAPIVILLSLVLLRLHALGGTEWLAFYGGLGLILGSYFGLTWLPSMSPFANPVAAAWAAVGLGHFWIVASVQRSPIRTGVQRLGGIDGAHWFSLRRAWGYCILALVHGAVVWGLLEFESEPRAVAPMIAGAASIFLHQGIIRRSQLYFWLAFVEVFLALHTGFVVESFLDKDQVIWALLALWAFKVFVYDRHARNLGGKEGKPFASILMLAAFGHVIYHHPSSITGLLAITAGAVLAALNPRKTRRPESADAWIGAAGLACVPVWLAYWSQARFLEVGLAAVNDAWPFFCAVGVMLGIAFLGSQFQGRSAERYLLKERYNPRILDHVLFLFASHSRQILNRALWASPAILGVILAAHYGEPYEPKELATGVGLWIAIAGGWYFRIRETTSFVPAFLAQASALGAVIMVRQQLMLTLGDWSYEYDVWASVLVSLAVSGAKQLIDRGPRNVRVPSMITLCVMPVMAVAWILIHDLGPDISLIVVGLNSLIFAYLGRGEKDSPYNAVATLGFVAFVLLAFWTKLELRTVQAFVIPTGAGILVLLQLFHEHIQKETRTAVRLATLMGMLGSAGYYAIADPSHPVVFHLTMVLLCLATMGLGGWLRIRLYLLLGFSGLIVDLCSLAYRELVSMDRGLRMTIIGSMVLLIGIALVTGAIYFKAHKEEIEAKFRKFRSVSTEWE
jgi:hypothetical protein